MSSCQHALSPTLPPLGSLVRVLWYGGALRAAPAMSGIVMAVDPDWGTAEVLVTSTGSGETWIRRRRLRELVVLEQ